MSLFASIVFAPPQASTFAEDYDRLFWYITLVTISSAVVVYCGLAYSCFAFAKKSETDVTPRLLGSDKLEIAWSVTPLLFFLSFFVWGLKLYNEQLQPPSDAPEYFVVGKQWMWKIQHPSGQREINELHLASGQAIRLTGTSEDVIHDFGIPAFRSKFDVLPGRYFTTWYQPTTPGTYHIFCDQYCGMGHSQMVGKVHVMLPEDYTAWLEGTFPTSPGKTIDGSSAWEGRKLFLKLQCNACHNQESNARAPQLVGLYNTIRPVQGSTVVKANEEYLRESIRQPTAKVADGWKPIMPAYPVAQVGEIELRNLVAYIKSLKDGGQLPKRTEQFPAPVGAPGAPTSEGGLPK